VLDVPQDGFVYCKSQMGMPEWTQLSYFRSSCGVSVPSPTVAPEYETCAQLEDFGLNCLILADDDEAYEQYCKPMKSTMSTSCLQQVKTLREKERDGEIEREESFVRDKLSYFYCGHHLSYHV
jgi:hypothetical protein